MDSEITPETTDLPMPGEPQPSKPTLRRPEDMTATEQANLAAVMTPDELKGVGRKGVDDFEKDLSSRAGRMQKVTELAEMYALVAKQKNFPFHKAANVKTPSLTGPCLQIQARLFDMVWPANGKIFTVVPTTFMDQQFANVTETFANAYVRYRMPYMSQGLDDTLHQMTLYGSAFRRTYWDAYEQKVRSDWIPLEDFVVAYDQRSQDPSMSDVPRYTMVHHMSTMDIEAYGRDGIYVNVDQIKGKPNEQGQEQFREAQKRIDGVTPDDEDNSKPRQVLEQHCKWRLPDDPTRHPAFDGQEHYVVVTLDAVSEVVLRISLREEDDPDDKRRFDREMAAYQQAQMRALMAAVAPQTQSALPAMGGEPDMAATPPPEGPPTSTEPEIAPEMAAPEAPEAPAPAPDAMLAPQPELPPMPNPVRKRQICFFTHYRCFPSEGFYGLGYGDLLFGLTTAENTVINQFIDGMTLKNAKPMFMSRQVRMQRGAVNVQPGEVIEIDGPVNQIKDAIMFLDPPNGDPGTVPLIKMLSSMKDIMVGNSDLMSGQAPGSNQTKAGMQILNEQMMAPITVLARRVKEAFKHELAKIWRCWGVFLPDDEVVEVVGEGNQPQKMRLGKWMFTPSAHLSPASDPRMKSQRLEDIQQLTGFAMSLPIIAQNPAVGGPIMTKLAEMVFRIFPDGEQLIPLLQPPPPPPPQPASQLEENAGFLQGQDHPVHPADNDEQHLAELQHFMASQEGSLMDTKGKVMAQNHLRAHAAQAMKKRGGALGPNPAFGPQGSGPPPMAGPPGLPPGAGAPQG